MKNKTKIIKLILFFFCISTLIYNCGSEINPFNPPRSDGTANQQGKYYFNGDTNVSAYCIPTYREVNSITAQVKAPGMNYGAPQTLTNNNGVYTITFTSTTNGTYTVKFNIDNANYVIDGETVTTVLIYENEVQCDNRLNNYLASITNFTSTNWNEIKEYWMNTNIIGTPMDAACRKGDNETFYIHFISSQGDLDYSQQQFKASIMSNSLLVIKPDENLINKIQQHLNTP